MPLLPLASIANRALLAIAVFTFASWTLAAALLLAWAPARAAAHRTLAHLASTWPVAPEPSRASADAARIAPLMAAASARTSSFSFGDDGDAAETGRLGGPLGTAGARLAAIEARCATRAAARGSADEARAHIDEMRPELAKLREELSLKRAAHADRQRALLRRLSELSARQREVSSEVRERVRELARRALREGKAERPHANA